MFNPKATVAAVCLTLSLGGLAMPSSAAGWDIDRAMDESTARAMLNRFGYGADQASLTQALQQTPRQYLLRAIHGGSALPPAIQAQIDALPIAVPLDKIWPDYGPGGAVRQASQDETSKKALQQVEHGYLDAAVQARMLTLANADNQGHEALLSFWLNHFSIYGPKGLDPLLAWDYTRALERAMADDSFESLLRASFFHPAMQVYLDNDQSTSPESETGLMAEQRGKPVGINENLAREVMELHTLGVGAGYSQQDVQQLARIITGAGLYSPRMQQRALDRAGAQRDGQFLFDPRRHDFGLKLFLGQAFPPGHGLDEIDRALHLLAIHPATAHHVSLQLAQRFLSDTPPQSVIDAMTRAYEQSGGRLSATLLPLIASPAFAASLQTPGKFKEPLDYIVSTARAACSGQAIGNGQLLAAAARDMGEAPYLHSTPDGYGAREADWLSPPAMAKRIRFAMGIAAGRTPLARADAVPDKPAQDASAPQKPAWATGEACAPDLATVYRLVGPLSPNTTAAAAQLQGKALIGFTLASPEFMRR